MIEIEWTSQAFKQLESLPQTLAFEIVRRTDLLASFPEIGSLLISEDPGLRKCRQLIIKSTQRVIYEFDKTESTVYILAVQHCRQKLPTGRELKRRQPPEHT